MSLYTKRVSCRSFDPTPLNQDQLQTVVDAARHAPIGRGRYDLWQLRLVTEENRLLRLGRAAGEKGEPFYGAPALLIACCPLIEREFAAWASAGCIIENAALAATQLGLGSVILLSPMLALAESALWPSELDLDSSCRPRMALAFGTSAKPLSERDESRTIPVKAFT